MNLELTLHLQGLVSRGHCELLQTQGEQLGTCLYTSGPATTAEAHRTLLCSGPLYESPPDSEEGCTHHSVIELHWGAGGNSCLQTLRADVATLKVTSSFLEEHPVHLHFSLLCRPLWPRTCSSRVPICVSPGPIPRRAAQVGVLREASPLCLLRVLTDDITALQQWLLLCVTFSRVGRHFQLGVPFTCGCDSSPALQVCPVVAATACKGF